MATVVIVFRSTPSSGSMNWPVSLRTSSVRRGRISLTELTSVVLPAPKPPATRILIVTGKSAAGQPGSDSAEAIYHVLQDFQVCDLGARRPPDSDQAAFAHVGQQNADDTEGQLKVRRQVGHGPEGLAALQHQTVLRLPHPQVRKCVADRPDDREQVEILPGRLGASAGQGVRANDWPRIPVHPLALPAGHGGLPHPGVTFWP